MLFLCTDIAKVLMINVLLGKVLKKNFDSDLLLAVMNMSGELFNSVFFWLNTIFQYISFFH